MNKFLFQQKKIFFVLFLLSLGLFAQKQNYLSINGDSKYKNSAKYFEYVNANAPKGGTLKLSSSGTFDSLNAFILKGTSASGVELLFDTLLRPSKDESSVSYPLIAQFVELSPSNSWVKFHINKNAKFQDGEPITAYDVKFSFKMLMEKGNPFYTP